MSVECKGLKLKLNVDIYVFEVCLVEWVFVSVY